MLYRNKVFVGGHKAASGSDYLLEYDVSADTWQVFIKTPVQLYGLTVFQDQVLLVGGFNFNDRSYSVAVYSLYMGQKSHFLRDDIIPPMLTPRAQASVASQDQVIAVAGGRNTSSNLRCIEVFHAPTRQWCSAHSFPSGRSSMSSILHKGSWYLLGGDMEDAVPSKNMRINFKMLVSSAHQKYGSFSHMKTLRKPCDNEGIHSGVGIVNQMIVLIGAGGTKKIFMLSTNDPVSWIELGELPVVLKESCAVTLDNRIMLIGGKDEHGKNTNTVYVMYLQTKMA